MSRYETFGYKPIDKESKESSGEGIVPGHRSSRTDSLTPKPIGTPRLHEERDSLHNKPAEGSESPKLEADKTKPAQPELVEEPPFDYGD